MCSSAVTFRRLSSVNLNGMAIGAVRDFLVHPAPYFNSGVMVMDLAQWRNQSLGTRVLDHHVGDPQGVTDQEALNAVAPWHELDYCWNVQHGNLFFAGMHGFVPRPERDAFTDALIARRWDLYKTAAVLHFVGNVKPWQRLCPLPGTTAWIRTLVRTGWLTSQEVPQWLARYPTSRSRYALGTVRAAALGSVLQASRATQIPGVTFGRR